MAFTAGQRIICIHDFSWVKVKSVVLPEKFKIYTFRSYCPITGNVALLLQEIKNSPMRFHPHYYGEQRGEPSFGSKYFRHLFDLSSLLLSEKELENC